MSELNAGINHLEILSSAPDVAAAHLVGGALSGIGGLQKTHAIHQEFVDNSIPHTAAAILSADAVHYAVKVTGLEGIITTYTQFAQREHPLVAAHLTTATNAQFQGNKALEQILGMHEQVSSLGQKDGLTGLGAAVLLADLLKKKMIFQNGTALINCWQEAKQLNTSPNPGEYSTAHLATALLQTAPKWMINFTKVPQKTAQTFNYFQQVTGNIEAAAVLASLQMKNYSSINIQQQITQWYHRAKEMI